MTDVEHVEIAVLGGGSATETLVREIREHGSDASIVVFEPERVGGECPFVACMPSKAMLHDARAGVTWSDAVDRRSKITEGLDDSGHADEMREQGVELVRSRAHLVDERTVVGGGRTFRADHIVVATGATPIMPPIEGTPRPPQSGDDPVWTSADALTSRELPDGLVIVGAGVVGTECATIFAGFGTDVTLVDNSARSLPDAPPEVGALVARQLADLGVAVRREVEAERIRREPDGGVTVCLTDGSEVRGDRVLVAIGRHPATTDIGLEHLDLDPETPLPVGENGRVDAPGSLWAIGDVAALGEYTHLANHQARVVADHLAGSARRRFDDVVLPRCMFTDPPMFEVGPSWSDLRDDDDIVEVDTALETFPRSITDRLPPGHVWAAARRSTGRLVAAAGVGPSFDELAHALVVAIDGDVPVDRLRQSMQPFPTIGEILGPTFADLHDRLRT